MKALLMTLRFGRLAGFLSMFLALFFMSATMGLDTYEIYLNNKLLMKQSVMQSLPLGNLKLTKANAKDDLSIRYNQCKKPGKAASGRKITLKDEAGRIVKEWRFKDEDDTL